MNRTKPITKEQWNDDRSIKAAVRSASVSQAAENRKILDTCVGEYNAVKIRIAWGSYGPGTVEKPTPRYWWHLGDNATVVCRNADVAEWFIGELKKWIKDMDGVVLEVVA